MSKESFAEAREASAGIAKEIANKLDLREDEVSILLCSADGKALLFLFPEALFKTGVKLPNDLNSLAGQAAYYKKPRIHNNMTEVKHMAFFERVKTSEEAPLPIQKMMTIPVSGGDEVSCVIQCSRKARTLEEAGPDFEKEDAGKLDTEVDELVMMMSLLRPEDF